MTDKKKAIWPIAERGEDMEMTDRNRKGAERLAKWQRELLAKKLEDKS
jgi:hypothetical protein